MGQRTLHARRDDPSQLVPDPVVPVPRASMTGPTGRACHVRCSFARMAGIGILPLGWNRFVGESAHLYADAVFDVETEPAFGIFGAIWRDIAGLRDHREIADVFDRHLLAALGPEDDREDEIERVHAALADPEITDVGQLAERLGLNSQYVERLCRRVFGFPPKACCVVSVFCARLAPRIFDPALKWVKVLDASYHDQAISAAISATSWACRPAPFSTCPARSARRRSGRGPRRWASRCKYCTGPEATPCLTPEIMPQ
jgi:hypothetical protein